MHRPHRSIEVFDISLMAVVTKAMGAFLVIMLLLMPYYSSGSLGDKNAADAAKELAAAQQQLKAAMQRLAGGNPEELAKLLEEARRRLQQAEQSIARLKRDNDALNSQARRLDAENSALRDKLAKLEAEWRKIRVNGYLVSWDCADVRIELGLMQKGEYIEATKNNPKLTYLLNHGLSLGNSRTYTEQNVIASHMEAGKGGVVTDLLVGPDRDATARGHRRQFEQSDFHYAPEPGKYYLVLASTSKSVTKIDGLDSNALKHVASDCGVLVSLNYYVPASNTFYSYSVREVTLGKNDYAIMVAQLAVTADSMDWQAPSADAVEWLRDQIDHAQKADAKTERLPPSARRDAAK